MAKPKQVELLVVSRLLRTDLGFARLMKIPSLGALQSNSVSNKKDAHPRHRGDNRKKKDLDLDINSHVTVALGSIRQSSCESVELILLLYCNLVPPSPSRVFFKFTCSLVFDEKPKRATATANQRPRLQTFGYLRNSSLALIGFHRCSTRWPV